mmetsp:Transcript_17592/g.29644  ORF Transcript_17592/g.29644 Transcript_17592/m.29644 type:complete len:174 (+) Transcript_17592:30-551(+)
MTSIILAVVFAAFVSVLSHEQPGLLQRLKKSQDEVDCSPEGVNFQSYHVHVLFWQNNQNSTLSAMKLQQDFMDAFGLKRNENHCQFQPGDTEPDADMCYFETDWEPAGPFVTAQYAFFVPVAQYEESVSYMLKRRGKLDVLVHPNSGCGYEDHLIYSSWGGNVWEIDPTVFLD